MVVHPPGLLILGQRADLAGSRGLADSSRRQGTWPSGLAAEDVSERPGHHT